MNKQLFFTLLKTLLTFGGSYLVGHNLFGASVDNSTLEVLVGAAMAVGSTVWSFFDKTYTIESLQAVVRQVILVIGGLLVSSGRVKDETVKQIEGLALVLIPFLQSILSKKKAEQIQTGEIEVKSLRTLKNTEPKL